MQKLINIKDHKNMLYMRKYLERNNEITFSTDYVDEVKVTRMTYTGSFMMNQMNFMEWLLLAILDRCSGFYGYRRTILGNSKH
jgi:hypothetical protein|tara:strand:- start:2731 stop:2979 length:249 start_codon:yes stop_codon:yes gene_type:complete